MKEFELANEEQAIAFNFANEISGAPFTNMD